MQPASVSSSLRQQGGFTLIELMIVVVVISILASIAYPAYSRYIVKGHRAAAQGHMMNWGHTQGEYLADSRAYATDAQLKALVAVPADIASRYDCASAAPDTGIGYTITCTPRSGTTQYGDVTLTLNHLGVKGPAGSW